MDSRGGWRPLARSCVVRCRRVLRLWPVFALGPRFSGRVAIQPGHKLVTTGSTGSFAIPAIWSHGGRSCRRAAPHIPRTPADATRRGNAARHRRSRSAPPPPDADRQPGAGRVVRQIPGPRHWPRRTPAGRSVGGPCTQQPRGRWRTGKNGASAWGTLRGNPARAAYEGRRASPRDAAGEVGREGGAKATRTQLGGASGVVAGADAPGRRPPRRAAPPRGGPRLGARCGGSHRGRCREGKPDSVWRCWALSR